MGRGSRVAVFGDYDVDGVCSTAIMLRTLRALGAEVVELPSDSSAPVLLSSAVPSSVVATPEVDASRVGSIPLEPPVILDIGSQDKRLVARLSGDTHLLLEIGQPELDLVLRFRGHALMQALEATPPDLAADIVDRGVMLTGGGALLGDLDLALREQTGLSISVANESLNCVALGTGKALEYEKQLRHVIDYDS